MTTNDHTAESTQEPVAESDTLPERSLRKLRDEAIHEALQKMTADGVSLRKIRVFVADNAAVKISAERLGTYLKATFDYVSPRAKAIAEKNRGG